MIVGILQFELLIHHAESLKDKRRVVQSVKDKLHREHQVSVAEVAHQENMRLAVLGLAIVGSDGKYIGDVLSSISHKLRALHDAELGDVTREILRGHAGEMQRRGRGTEESPSDDADMMPADIITELAERGEAGLNEAEREARGQR
jgi:uncharacterized protein YlxP (DUF503 family)